MAEQQTGLQKVPAQALYPVEVAKESAPKEDAPVSLTELLFILDRSGSMTGLESDTIGGFNAVLKQHKEAPGDAVVSTVLFDHESIVLHDRAPIQTVPPLGPKDYSVRGSTALFDATGNAVRFISKIQGYLPNEAKPQKTIVVIVTDGYENASTTWTLPALRQLIEQKRQEGWEFLFLGANIDAEREAATLGIDEDYAATYVADSAGQAVMYKAVAQASRQMRCSESAVGASWKDAITRDRTSRANDTHQARRKDQNDSKGKGHGRRSHRRWF